MSTNARYDVWKKLNDCLSGPKISIIIEGIKRIEVRSHIVQKDAFTCSIKFIYKSLFFYAYIYMADTCAMSDHRSQNLFYVFNR